MQAALPDQHNSSAARQCNTKGVCRQRLPRAIQFPVFSCGTHSLKRQHFDILRDMSVQVQQTPNPNAMKFTLPERIFPSPQSFASGDAAAAHPLAAAIFALGGVYNVFMVQDFVTVNKLPDVEWSVLTVPVQTCIAEYLSSIIR